MKVADVADMQEDAPLASGYNNDTVAHRLRPLSDNGSRYISCDLARRLEEQSMDRVRGTPNHLQTQVKIES